MSTARIVDIPLRRIDAGATGASAGEGRWHSTVAGMLPRLQEACGALHRHVRESSCGMLHAVLQAHLSAVGALHFELLVSPGLRASPREKDAAMFRKEVAAVSGCTEATWIAARRFLEEAASSRAETEALASDFAIEMRALHRRVGEAAQTAATVQAHLQARAGAQPQLSGQKGFCELVTRNTSDRELLDQLQRMCESTRPAQSAAYQLAECQSALRSALGDLTARLRGGLLERLRVLVSGDVDAPAAELREAQQARAELQSALAEAIAATMRVQACCQDLGVWLGSIESECAALVPAQGSA